MSEFLEFYAMNVKLLHSRQCFTVNISQRCFAQSNLCVTAFASVWQLNTNLTCLIGLTQLYVRQTRLDVYFFFDFEAFFVLKVSLSNLFHQTVIKIQSTTQEDSSCCSTKRRD